MFNWSLKFMYVNFKVMLEVKYDVINNLYFILVKCFKILIEKVCVFFF